MELFIVAILLTLHTWQVQYFAVHSRPVTSEVYPYNEALLSLCVDITWSIP